MGRIWTERDGGGEERLFQPKRERKQERWGVFGAQEIISVGCEGEEIEVSAAKLDWGHII